MKSVTVEDVIGWHPCYLDQFDKGEPYLRRLYAARNRWTAIQIIDDMPPQGVPPQDVLWTVLRTELVSDADLHELACQFAEGALLSERAAGREPDVRSLAAIGAKRAWMRHEITDEQLAAARDAARDAAYAAARNAAWAARNAAWAALGAASDAAWDAAWAAQVSIVRSLLTSGGDR